MPTPRTSPSSAPAAHLRAALWLLLLAGAASALGGCGSDTPVAGNLPPEIPPAFNDPVPDPEAAAAAFRLFYRERVERAVIAYNRFGIFGDSVFATTVGSKAVAKSGDQFEVVPGPTDNNLIGTSAFGVWHAYKVFRTRVLALTLIRMFEGISFLEEVTGIPGLTVREALPGWTRVMDGTAGTVARTRYGEPVVHPAPPPPSLEAEVLDTFYRGVRFTYRENPGEFMFRHMPAADVTGYAITYSIDERPRFIRVSNCCRSSMQTPEGFPWAGAWWGNHNSRDNLPDLVLGIFAAMEAAGDPEADPDLRAAAARAVDAGQRIGDLIRASGGNLMTVDEYHAYGDLTVGGAVRPHGDPENQDLGSMAACPMSYMAEAASTAGVDLPLPELPQPGEIEEMMLRDLLGIDLDLPMQYCASINDAYFATTYATLLRSEPLGIPWLALIEFLDRLENGLAEQIIGSFQNDYDDIVESTLGLVLYARIQGRTALEETARAALLDQTGLMRAFADVLFARTDPARRARQYYEAAVFDAIGGNDTVRADFGGFEEAEARIASIESLLRMGDTAPAPWLTDAEILDRVEQALAREKRGSVVQRYRDAYGSTPPVRRNPAGDGYEARTSRDPQWRPVERPRHRRYGGHELLQEIPICVHAPHVLDCTWARLGCAAADLDGSGAADDADRARFETALASFGDVPENGCHPANGWCGGADLDRTGEPDDLDRAFMEAAQGCRTDSP